MRNHLKLQETVQETVRKKVMGMVVVVVIAIVVIVAVWYSLSNQANSNQQDNTGAVTHQRITPQEYQASYATREHLLVDVRSAEEFGTGHIAGAVNIAIQSLPERMATLPKERSMVLYCRSGARSHAAATMLAQAGFDNVYDLGGITQWRAQGLPVKG